MNASVQHGAAASFAVIRGDALVRMPWKNGGGVTREIAAHPADAGLDTFAWRISVADVNAAGPFSRFDGIDRTLVLLDGAGLRLDIENGASHALTRPLDSLSFAGDAPVNARLIAGPTRDFNVMARRGVACAHVDVWRGGTQATLTADIALLFCASGRLAVAAGDREPVVLVTGDTLRIDAPRGLNCDLRGDGALLAVRIDDATRGATPHSPHG